MLLLKARCFLAFNTFILMMILVLFHVFLCFEMKFVVSYLSNVVPQQVSASDLNFYLFIIVLFQSKKKKKKAVLLHDLDQC